MNRLAVFSAFVERWVPSWKTIPEAGHLLDEIELQADLKLPLSYRKFVLNYGTPVTAGILESIVKGQHHIEDIQEFIGLDQLVSDTKLYESGGMDSGFLGFASDCMGNMFLFKRTECLNAINDAPVWFFDHDFVTIDKISDSFTAWLSRYNEIEVVKD
jgi:hypothetical protein